MSKTAAPYTNGSSLKPTLAERAYQQIRQQILGFELAPGTVVSERALAERLGLGKAPIRSALIRLASDGFVSIASRQGIVISTPSIQDVIELFQVRVAMELVIVRHIAGTLNGEQVDRLRTNLEEYASLAETAAPVESVAVDFEFHRLLCEFHGNRQMERVLDRVFDSLYREIRTAQARFPRRIWTSVQEHQAVADALIAGNGEEAETLMRNHLRFGEQFILSRGHH